jgi:DNA excision repair protein ERCC-3
VEHQLLSVFIGISAAARIKKSCLVLCTNSVSVDQWRYQFTLWSTLQQEQVRAYYLCTTCCSP